MMWVVLIGSGVLEAVWATALGRSEGLSKPGPTALFLVALIASMIGLAMALREIPVGTGYAVWVGVGAALTATYAMISGDEPVSALRIALLAGIVACVAGLKLSH
ncbi:MAG: multidrug efflux SMR transporter [Chloroflexota bacterium]|nr:multidrug efflux SMR transporter [Chloroflexota bacterium]